MHGFLKSVKWEILNAATFKNDLGEELCITIASPALIRDVMLQFFYRFELGTCTAVVAQQHATFAAFEQGDLWLGMQQKFYRSKIWVWTS